MSGPVYITESFVIYTAVTSYFSLFMLMIAWIPEITETSCSTLFPPNRTAILVFIKSP